MYDRESRSLWSQIESKAISGKYSGKELKILPSEITSWKNWKSNYPETLVLTTDTGYNIDYQKKAYQQYKSSDRLMFPVPVKSELLKNKDVIVGITFKGVQKAYPIKNFNANSRKFRDIIAGKVITIKVNETLTDAVITNMKGEQIPHMRTYWFAWYAFHPGTLLYKR